MFHLGEHTWSDGRKDGHTETLVSNITLNETCGFLVLQYWALVQILKMKEKRLCCSCILSWICFNAMFLLFPVVFALSLALSSSSALLDAFLQGAFMLWICFKQGKA